MRGDVEPELRGELVKLLVSASVIDSGSTGQGLLDNLRLYRILGQVNAGARVNQGVLDNLSTSLPSLR